MPLIKFKHVVSFSSEDKVYKAENLLTLDTYRKWKCAKSEKQASVVLQFEKAEQIHSIDIGNEGSAFIEVLVNRSSDSSKDFQILLVASSFMSPLESRQGTNPNRVRMFGTDALNQDTSKEKWDLVKIVCTQPYNKTSQYGLSFIKFYSPPENASSSQESIPSLGAFKLKTITEKDNEISLGNWFNKRKNDENLTSPANIRNSTSFASAVIANKKTFDFKKSLESSAEKRKHEASINESESRKKSMGELTTQNNIKNDNDKDSHSLKTIIKSSNKVKPMSAEQTSMKEKDCGDNSKPLNSVNDQKIPFHKIMAKVVFVLSGFQNPFRSQLRDKALEMGAKYKADWDKSCTHLVCAFINTPKYNQVMGQKGQIVTKEWILECYKQRKLLPWTNFKLGNYSHSSSSPSSISQSGISSDKSNHKKSSRACTSSKAYNITNNNEDSPEEDNDDEDADPAYAASTDVDTDSEDDEVDTEDEIERIKAESNSKPQTSNLPLPPLPDFFKNKHFLLYGEFPSAKQRMLERYIIGYGGTLENYMSEEVKYVITQQKWDEHFEEALLENDNLVFVKPEWIFKCADQGKLTPFQPHVIVPDA